MLLASLGVLLAVTLGVSVETPTNVLLILADDVGVDRIGAYAEHPVPGKTPVIDALAEQGVLFRNAWSNPTCSPTRATILTGRFAFRTGIGIATMPDGVQTGLSAAEITLPELLGRAAGCRPSTALFGKWHLGSDARDVLSPLEAGFDIYAGCLFNLPSYFAWDKQINTLSVRSTTYATTDTTDDAMRAISHLPEPWFVMVSYHAAHDPFHWPPPALHSQSTQLINVSIRHRAMVEAMDTEIGRLLSSFSSAELARTTIILAGDNGTPGVATTLPFLAAHAKKTVYEGGINVPLIISGAHVQARGRESAALVNTTDLYATVAQLMSVDPARELPPGHPIDSLSLTPYLRAPELPSLREFAYAERFSPNGPGPYEFRIRAIRNARWKLIVSESPDKEELYDLLLDPFELVDRLASLPLDPEAQSSYASLKAGLEQFTADA